MNLYPQQDTSSENKPLDTRPPLITITFSTATTPPRAERHLDLTDFGLLQVEGRNYGSLSSGLLVGVLIVAHRFFFWSRRQLHARGAQCRVPDMACQIAFAFTILFAMYQFSRFEHAFGVT